MKFDKNASLKKKLKAIGLYFATTILSIGVIVAFGLLSASGMLLLSPTLALIIGAFIFGGVVEGQVFGEEIFEGLQDFALLGKRGYRRLICNELDHQLKVTPAISGFLLEYQSLQRYLLSVQGKKLSEDQKKEKKRARKQLKEMQKFFAEHTSE